MAELKFVTGDATQPQGEGTKLIVHCCNNVGSWGAGFVLALSNRWKEPEAEYRKMGLSMASDVQRNKALGSVDTMKVEEDIWVANLIGQDGVKKSGHDGTIPPIRYEAIRKGFYYLAGMCLDPHRKSVHMPRIGSGLAGGDWAIIELLVNDTLIKLGVDVTVYNFPGGEFFDSRIPVDDGSKVEGHYMRFKVPDDD